MNTVRPVPPFGLVFPDSDGQPIAENTRQYEAIVTLKGNIEAFAPSTAFVAGDHLIYVDPSDPTARQAPDVFVAFDRPRGHRGSYKVWEEANVFPQVIFVILGPSNTAAEIRAKRRFYFHHGAQEYYEFDPEAGTWIGFVLDHDTGLPRQIEDMDAHVSPLLGMKFAIKPLGLLLYRPDGSRFLSFQELNDLIDEQRERAEEHRQQAEHERQRTDHEHLRAELEKQHAASAAAENERLRALLLAAGIDPGPFPS